MENLDRMASHLKVLAEQVNHAQVNLQELNRKIDYIYEGFKSLTINKLKHEPTIKTLDTQDLQQFIKDCCELTNAFITVNKLYQAYDNWCNNSKHTPMSKSKFSRLLGQFPGIIHSRTSQARAFKGIITL